MDYEMNKIIGIITTVIIQSVFIGAVAIPLIIDEQNPGDVDPGDEWSRSFSTNLPDKDPSLVTATITGGNGQHYCHIERQAGSDSQPSNVFIIKGSFPENGTYTVEVTVKTLNPTQYASKTFSVNVQDSSDYNLLLIIPTFLIIGLVLYIVNYLGIIDLSSVGSSVGGYFRKDGGDPIDSVNDEWADR